MTAKQNDFIGTLIRERNLDSLTNAQQEYLRRVRFEGVTPTNEQASRIITALLACPPIVARTAAPAEPVEVPAGRYAI